MKLERRRYILVDYLASAPIKEKVFLRRFWQTYNRFFGEVNASCVGLFIVNHEWENKRLIIKCSHTQKDNVIKCDNPHA